MVKTEKAAFLTNSKALIYWHKPAEWAQLIYKFVERIGGIGSIYTVYDLIEGDESHNEGTSCYDLLCLSNHLLYRIP